MMECDEMAVPKDLWDRAKSGDDQAKNELKNMFDGMQLYSHILYMGPDMDEKYYSITAREFSSVMWDSVTLRIGFE